jgi:hypothetical protein
LRRLSKKQLLDGHNTQKTRKLAGEDVMDSTNGTTSTVKLNAASAPPNGNVLPRETSEPSQTTARMQPIQDWYLYALAAVIILGFFGLTVLLMIPATKISTVEGNKEIVFMLFGGLVTGFSMVLSYFFGSSAGSAQKTVELAKVAKNR